MAESDFSSSYIVGYGSSPSRRGPVQHACWRWPTIEDFSARLASPRNLDLAVRFPSPAPPSVRHPWPEMVLGEVEISNPNTRRCDREGVVKSKLSFGGLSVGLTGCFPPKNSDAETVVIFIEWGCEREEGAERTRALMPHKAGYTLGFHQHEVAEEHHAHSRRRQVLRRALSSQNLRRLHGHP
jgi:hypothetical protein